MAVAARYKVLACLEKRCEYDCQHNTDKEVARAPTSERNRSAKQSERDTTFNIRRRTGHRTDGDGTQCDGRYGQHESQDNPPGNPNHTGN